MTTSTVVAAQPELGMPDLTVEPLQRGDTVAVLEVFEHLGARSRRHRFLGPKPRLASADLRSLTSVDDRNHVALVARDPDGRAIAIARFVRVRGSGTAEVAVEVVDAYQGRGLGTLLVTALMGRARDVGVTRFSVLMALDNLRAARLMRRMSPEVTRIGGGHGTAEFEVALTDRPSATSVSARARRCSRAPRARGR